MAASRGAVGGVWLVVAARSAFGSDGTHPACGRGAQRGGRDPCGRRTFRGCGVRGAGAVGEGGEEVAINSCNRGRGVAKEEFRSILGVSKQVMEGGVGDHASALFQQGELIHTLQHFAPSWRYAKVKVLIS